MTRPAKPRYRTTNWRSYDAALKRRGSLEIWFDPEVAWFAAPTGKRGRQPIFSDAAIQTCLMLKALFGLPLRQTTGLVASLIKVAGLDGPTPNFSTLRRRQKGLDVMIGYRPAKKGALHLLVPSRGLLANRCRAADGAGIKVAGDGEWSARKYGPSKPRQWRRVHLGGDADMLEIRAVEVTRCRVGPSRGLLANRCRVTDAPMLPALLDQIPEDQPIDARGCHAAIAARAAQTVIPPRKNGKPRKEHMPGAHVSTTRRCAPAAVSDAPSGDDGAAIIAEAGSRPRCAVSRRPARGSSRAISNARSPSFTAASRRSTASPASARPSRSAWRESVRGRRGSPFNRILRQRHLARKTMTATKER